MEEKMKKSYALVGTFAAALLFAGCASTKEAAKTDTAKKDDAKAAVVAEAPIVCGAWNEDKTAYTLDLTKISPNDSKVTMNADGSATVTWESSYKSILFPIPYTDADFMNKVNHCTITMSSAATVQKKLAWKLSNDVRFAWEKGGGILGQGDHCVGFMFHDYDDPWADTAVDLYFNGDDTSFGKFTDNMYKGVKALAMCNNTTPAPFVFTIKSIVFTCDAPGAADAK